ncbi:MAG: M48 family metalloprotease [Hydrogenophaga sp.]|nr:M48 family metalloprotease [Hydrogenophaga sp.]
MPWARGAAVALLACAALVAAAQTKPGERIQVGRKAVSLASIDGDGKCTKMVAPFDLSSNFVELTRVGFTEGFRSIFNLGQTAAAPGGYKVSAAVRTAAARMNWLPMPLEVAYGEHYLGVIRDSGKLIEREDDPKLYAAADTLMQRATEGIGESHPYQFQVFVRASNEGNAMALPGGFIFLDSNLLKDSRKYNMAHLAFAHEIAHVLQRHETRALQARIIDTLALSMSLTELMEQLTNISQGQTEVLKTVVSGKLQFERHKVHQELQSDACAVRITQRMFDDDARLYSAVRDFLASLPPAIGKDHADLAVVTSTNLADVAAIVERPVDRHPSTGEREALFKDVLSELKAGGVKAATKLPPSTR